MVGKSTCGSGETGSTVKATAPARATATVSSVVATGRRMKGADSIMTLSGGGGWSSGGLESAGPATPGQRSKKM